MNKLPPRLRQVIFAVLGTLILATVVYTDITSEMRFTEDSRNGVYERMSAGQPAQ